MEGPVMAIEIAPDNHLADLKEADEDSGELCTFEEFKEAVDSGACGPDEYVHWACVYEGRTYFTPKTLHLDRYGRLSFDIRPEWATHVYWYGA